MTVSERVELVKFDEPKYLEDGKAVVAQRKEAEDLAKVIHDQGYSNIFLLGIGGTEFEFCHYEYLMSRMSDVDVYAINAADANTVRPKKLNKDSLVITASSSGDTVEIVQAAKWLKEEGIRVVAFTGRDSKLGKMLDYVVHAPVVTGYCEHSYVLQAYFIYKLMNLRGDFDAYDRFADQLSEYIFEDLLAIKKKFEPIGLKMASELYDAEYTIFTGSGALWGETLLFSMCMLEEMQWIRCRPVNSAQFFHGTLELIEDKVPVFIVKGEDEFRAQDNRVEEFCKKINCQYAVFDASEYAVRLDNEFRKFIVPMITTACLTGRLSRHYEVYTKHNLQYRRYYRQFEY